MQTFYRNEKQNTYYTKIANPCKCEHFFILSIFNNWLGNNIITDVVLGHYMSNFLNVCVGQKEGRGLAGELVPCSMAGCCSSSGMMSMFSRLLFLLRGASLGQWNAIWKRKPRSTACLSTSMSLRASDKRVPLSWQRHSTILYNWPKTHKTVYSIQWYYWLIVGA